MRKQKLFLITLLILLTSMLFSGCVTKIAEPEVQEGRFDFSITYEVEGEVKTYDGVYVCKYEGAHTSLGGNGRDWSAYVENSDNNFELAVQTNEEGIVYISFGFSASYFMSDPDFELGGFEIPEPSIYLVYHSDDPNTRVSDSSLDFMGDYGIRIISYDYPDPIENNYKEKWSFARFEFGIN